MPIGSGKSGLLGGKGLTPGGSQSFNSPGTFTVPVGVNKVSVTGSGAPGNPGNPGNYGPGSPTTGQGAGGGRGGSLNYSQHQTDPATTHSYQTYGGTPGGSGYGINTPIPAGTSGASGSSGNPGTSGNPGPTSTALGYSFPGGTGGGGGTGVQAGVGGGAGGTGGSAGFSQSDCNHFHRIWPSQCSHQPYITTNAFNGGGGGQGYGVPTGNPGGQLAGFCCVHQKGQGGGGGTGTPNTNGRGGGGAGHDNAGIPGTTPGNWSTQPTHLWNSGGGGSWQPGHWDHCNGAHNPGHLGPQQGGTGTESYSAGGNATTSPGDRGGGGGGGGVNHHMPSGPNYGGGHHCGGGRGAGGGGGGGRGHSGYFSNAPVHGNPGNPGSTATYNCVPVSPGVSYPISATSPGSVTINWNPQ